MENIKEIKIYDAKGVLEEHSVNIKIIQEDNLSSAAYSIYCANAIIEGTNTKAERSTMDLARIRNRLEDAISKIETELIKYEIKLKEKENR